MKQEQEKRKPKYDRTQGFPKRLFDLLGGENADRGEYAKLAREIGVSTAAISNYISGLTGVSADNLIAIAKYFNVSTDYLLGLDDVPKRQGSPLSATAAYLGLPEDILEVLRYSDQIKMMLYLSRNAPRLHEPHTLDEILKANGITPEHNFSMSNFKFPEDK